MKALRPIVVPHTIVALAPMLAPRFTSLVFDQSQGDQIGDRLSENLMGAGPWLARSNLLQAKDTLKFAPNVDGRYQDGCDTVARQVVADEFCGERMDVGVVHSHASTITQGAKENRMADGVNRVTTAVMAGGALEQFETTQFALPFGKGPDTGPLNTADIGSRLGQDGQHHVQRSLTQISTTR